MKVPYDDEAYLHVRGFSSRSSLALSRDGRWIAATLQGLPASAGDDEKGEGRPLNVLSEELSGSEVVVVDTQTGEVRRPFQECTATCLPSWSPDGGTLALLTQHDVRRYPRVTLWSPESGDLRVFEAAIMKPIAAFFPLRWTADGSRLVFQSPARKLPPTFLNREISSEPLRRDYMESRLTVLDDASGILQTWSETKRASSFRLSPDDRQVAFLRAVPPPEGAPVNQANWRQLVLVNLEDGSEQVWGQPHSDNWGNCFAWSPDGRAIVWLAKAHQTEPKVLLSDFDCAGDWLQCDLPADAEFGWCDIGWYSPPMPLWNSEGTSFAVLGRKYLWQISRSGQAGDPQALPEGRGFDWLSNRLTGLDVPASESPGEFLLSRHNEVWKWNQTSASAECLWRKPESSPPLSRYWTERAFDAATNRLYTVRADSARNVTLWSTELSTGESKRLARLFEGPGELDGGEIRHLTWILPDGTACGGSLLLPVGWKIGGRPPVVMNVYGDDRNNGQLNSARFHTECDVVDAHLLSAHGYAVFIPDLPQTEVEPAASLLLAAECAVEALRADGCVDTDRIAVTGNSYGGYTTLCLLTGCKLFRAGIPSNGIYDLARTITYGMWGWTEAGQGLMRCTLWENPERYRVNSPLYALDKLEAPVLVLQGGDDDPDHQAIPLFYALRRLGKPSELLIYRDEGHGPTSWSIAAQRDLHAKFLEFLNLHLK